MLSKMEDKQPFQNKDKFLDELRHLKRHIPKMKNQDWLINFIHLARKFYAENLGLEGEFSYKDAEKKLKELGFSNDSIKNINDFNDKLFNLQFAPSKEKTSLHKLCGELENLIENTTEEYISINKKEEDEKKKPTRKHPIKEFLSELKERKEQQLILKIRRLIVKAYGYLENNNLKQAAKCYNEIVDLFDKTKEEHSRMKKEIKELYEEITT